MECRCIFQILSGAELLRKYREEACEEAFATLVHRHLPLVFGAAMRRLNNSALAEEVAQSVFVLLAQRAEILMRHSSLSGWLYRTTIHLAQNKGRAEFRRAQREHIALELGTLMKTDESASELAPLLDEALMGIAEKDREALLLRFFQAKQCAKWGKLFEFVKTPHKSESPRRWMT